METVAQQRSVAFHCRTWICLARCGKQSTSHPTPCDHGLACGASAIAVGVGTRAELTGHLVSAQNAEVVGEGVS